jgi:BMFP domain-containing protein YqiC
MAAREAVTKDLQPLLDAKNAALADRVAAMEAGATPPPADDTRTVEDKQQALAARLAAMEADQAALVDAFPPAPDPEARAKKPKKVG